MALISRWPIEFLYHYLPIHCIIRLSCYPDLIVLHNAVAHDNQYVNPLLANCGRDRAGALQRVHAYRFSCLTSARHPRALSSLLILP